MFYIFVHNVLVQVSERTSISDLAFSPYIWFLSFFLVTCQWHTTEDHCTVIPSSFICELFSITKHAVVSLVHYLTSKENYTYQKASHCIQRGNFCSQDKLKAVYRIYSRCPDKFPRCFLIYDKDPDLWVDAEISTSVAHLPPSFLGPSPFLSPLCLFFFFLLPVTEKEGLFKLCINIFSNGLF